MKRKTENTKREQQGKGNERKIRMSDDLLWGIHPVFEALDQETDRVSAVILVKHRKGGKGEGIIEKAKAAGIKINFVAALRLLGEKDRKSVVEGKSVG